MSFVPHLAKESTTDAAPLPVGVCPEAREEPQRSANDRVTDRDKRPVLFGDAEDARAKDVRISVAPLVAVQLAGIHAIAREHVAERANEQVERCIDISLGRGALAHGHARRITDA